MTCTDKRNAALTKHSAHHQQLRDQSWAAVWDQENSFSARTWERAPVFACECGEGSDRDLTVLIVTLSASALSMGILKRLFLIRPLRLPLRCFSKMVLEVFLKKCVSVQPFVSIMLSNWMLPSFLPITDKWSTGVLGPLSTQYTFKTFTYQVRHRSILPVEGFHFL